MAAAERMKVALEASGTGTFYWNIRSGELLWDEPLDVLFGLPPGEKVRSLEQFVDLVHPGDRAEVIERCQRCQQEAADFEMEWPADAGLDGVALTAAASSCRDSARP